MSAIDELLEDQLWSTASWRHDKAEQYPHDHRNKEAAEFLEKLAEEVATLRNSPDYHRPDKLEEELVDVSDGCKVYDLIHLSEDLSEYHRSIGFHSFPTAEGYLKDLIEIYSRHLDNAKEAAAEQRTEQRKLYAKFGLRAS